ncbi:6-bladed beta-propeller [Gemmatimonadota bacterium]
MAFLLISMHATGIGAQTTLADLYHDGEVRFVPEITITDADLPEDVYLTGFEQTWAITVDAGGNIYFADFGANNIKKFDQAGRFLNVIGREGSGPGDFRMPYFLGHSLDRLVVWDMGNTRFCFLNLEGEFISARPLDRSEEGWPGKIQTLPNGDIVMESNKGIFGEAGQEQITEIRLYSPEMVFRRIIYSNENLSRKTLPDSGRMIPVPFTPRVHWSVTPENRIVIGFSDEYRIEIHDATTGDMSAFEHEYSPVRVTRDDQDTWFASITSSDSEGNITFGAPDYIVDNTEFPRFKPAFGQIMVDSEGNILVQAFRQEMERDFRSFDAFRPSGEFLGTVEITDGGEYPQVGAPIIKSCMIVGEQGEFGEISLIKYRISKQE